MVASEIKSRKGQRERWSSTTGFIIACLIQIYHKIIHSTGTDHYSLSKISDNEKYMNITNSWSHFWTNKTT